MKFEKTNISDFLKNTGRKSQWKYSENGEVKREVDGVPLFKLEHGVIISDTGKINWDQPRIIEQLGAIIVPYYKGLDGLSRIGFFIKYLTKSGKL